MLQNTRALRRASAAASARAAITARRPMTILGTVCATLLGVTLSVGLASAPAAGAVTPDVAAAFPRTVLGADQFSSIADDTRSAVSTAEAAASVADALSDEVAASGLDVGTTVKVDTSTLEDRIDALDDAEVMPLLLLDTRLEEAAAETRRVVSETGVLRDAFTAAQQKKAAEDAARAAAEQKAAEEHAAQEAAAALAAANTVDGAKATARQLMASTYGWGGDQFSCLESLWTKESGWNYQAYNADGGATGIPQALPGSKMAAAGADWQSNAATQIAWGLGYISSAYGTPCSAWSHSQAMNWY
ncbi:phospholipase [uncultured Microbacterium sp.]|uniref:aggregation-promoting factor C-terminal-like domain-containing protein n=1 Tax=Microbacterium algeriense TaxID=2615184 RepID=UPI002595DDB1|nr:phospholipase [uncultured Microbacterium sp.]